MRRLTVAGHAYRTALTSFGFHFGIRTHRLDGLQPAECVNDDGQAYHVVITRNNGASWHLPPSSLGK
jgi:hypothetical protein